MNMSDDEFRRTIDKLRNGRTISDPGKLNFMKAEAKHRGLDYDTLLSGNMGTAAFEGFAEGANLGWGDEAVGALGGDRGQERRSDASLRYLYPKTSGLSDIGGEMFTGTVTLGAGPVANMVSKLPSYARALFTGVESAGQAATSSLGRAEDKVEHLGSRDFRRDLTYGVGGGAVGDVLGKGVELMLSGVGKNFGAKRTGKVRDELLRIARKAGVTPEQVVERIRMGDGPLFEASPDLLATVKYYTGAESGSSIRPLAQSRAATTRADVVNYLNEVQGGPRTREDNFRRAAELGETAKGKYNEAYGVGDPRLSSGEVNPGALLPEIEKVHALRPGVIDILNENAKARQIGAGHDPSALLAQDANGRLVFSRQPTTEDLEILDRTLRSVVTGEYTRDIISPEVATLTDNAQKAYRATMDTMFPELAAVRQQFATESQAIEAFQRGDKALRISDERAKLLAEWDSMNAGEKEMVRAGIINTISEDVANAGDKAQAFRRYLPGFEGEGSDTVRGEFLNRIFPGGSLQKRMQRAADAQQVYTFADPRAGSITAPAQQVEGQVGRGVQSAVQDAQQASSAGGATALVGKMIDSLTGGGLNQAEIDAVAHLAMSQNPELVAAAMKGDTEARSQLIRELGRAMGTAVGVQTDAIPILGDMILSPQQ